MIATYSQPFSLHSSMSGSETDNNIPVQNETLEELQAENRRLHQENSHLITKSQLSSEVQQEFFEGLSTLVTDMKTSAKSKTPPNSPVPPPIPTPDKLPDYYGDITPKIKTDNMGPPIAANIANLLEKCWHNPFTKEEIIQCLDEQIRPSNSKAVKPLEINDDVNMTKADLNKEKNYRYLGNAVCGAGKNLAYLLDMLAAAEQKIRAEYPDDNGWIIYEDFRFDLPKATKLLLTAMKILGIANFQTGQYRRLLLADKFKSDFKRLCDKDQPFTEGKFFGPSFDAATSVITSQNKTQNQAFQQTKKSRYAKKYYNKPAPYPSQVSALQAAVTQQAMAAAAVQPPVHQQISGLNAGNIFSINQYPHAQPLLSIPSTQPPPLQPRPKTKGSRKGPGQGLPPPIDIPLPHVPVGGRLRYFLPQWTQITSDKEVLSMVAGLEINLTDIPFQYKQPSELKFSAEEVAATDSLIEELINKNAVVRCDHEPYEYVSTVFLRRKANGSYRLVLNLKNFNAYVQYVRFKMTTLKKILTLVTRGSHMVSVDLCDAYLTVWVSLAFQCLLKFTWRGQLLKFVSMPFGLGESPRKFTKLCKPPLAIIRQAGYTIAAYLDDFFQCEQSYQVCKEALLHAYSLLVSLGFLPNHNKSSYEPSQIIEALGHIINSIEMTVTLPLSKKQAIVLLCSQAVCSQTMTIRHLCMLIGKLISCLLAHPLGHLHFRSMERLKNSALKQHKGNFEAFCSLTEPCILDLQWWITTLPSAAAPIHRGNCTSVFTCDAAMSGWGSCYNGKKSHGRFTVAEQTLSINCKEIMAVLFGLKSFAQFFPNEHVLVMSDSTCTVSVVQKMGSMDNPVHDSLAREIWEFAQSKGIWLTLTHLPGVLNVESDEASRQLGTENTEWCLPVNTFQLMLEVFRSHGPVVTDLMASRLNYKIKPYYSWGPDPFSVHVNCFTIKWDSPYVYYAYPPFSIIPLLLQKINLDQATVLTVFPLWPTQVWFNRLISLLISHIHILPTDPPVFLPWDPTRPHPLQKTMLLCTAVLSGNVAKQETFQKSLLTSSSMPKLTNIKKLVGQKLQSGERFVWRGKWINIIPLFKES